MNKTIGKYHTSITTILLLAIIYLLMLGLKAEEECTVTEPEVTTQIVYVYITNNDIKEEKVTNNKEEPQTKPVTKEFETNDIKEEKVTNTKTEPQSKPVGDTVRKPGTKEFEITAYDNTVQSQGKWVDQTASGFNLKGHSLESAKCIAVDPKVIPLGSKVKLYFDEEYKHLNGIYIARDTGGAIKGNKIDLFMGDGPVRKEVMAFGRRKVQVEIIE